MVKLNVRKIVSGVLPFLFVFLASIYLPLDPDLGWHLKYGEYFFQHWQPLRDNIYSSQMPNFHWANISWGADLFYYAFYHFGGFLGLTLGGAAVITLTFYLFSKAFDLDYWEQAIIFPIVLFFENPVNANSFRAQLLSMLLLGVLMYMLARFKKGSRKVFYFVPVLFWLWANLHGLFLLGLAIFFLWEGLFLLSKFLEERSLPHLLPYVKLFVPISLLSIVATLIHPFGVGIYYDALLHLNNPLLKWVTEYGAVEELSVQWYNVIVVAIVAGIGITAFIIKQTFSEKLPIVGAFSVIYFLSLWVRRYSWAMYYLVMPFLQPVANFIRPESKTGVFRGATVLFLVYLSVALFFKYPFLQFATYTWDDYCQEFLYCSAKSAEALRPYYKPGKTMTPYNLGGFMIWNYPEMKPSTDGRMHLWRDEKGYSGFEYDFTFAHNLRNIDDSKYDVVYALKTKPVYKRLKKLALQRKWKEVYEDKSTAIFIRI